MKNTKVLGEEARNTLLGILSDHAGTEGPLLPILHDVQHEFGYVPAEFLPDIAKELNISNAEIHGVVSFYHDFKDHPAGRKVVKLCRAEACQTMGADSLAEHVRQRHHLDWHGTTADGSVTLEPVFCLGLCACGPAALVDERPVARLDKQKLDTIIGGYN